MPVLYKPDFRSGLKYYQKILKYNLVATHQFSSWQRVSLCVSQSFPCVVSLKVLDAQSSPCFQMGPMAPMQRVGLMIRDLSANMQIYLSALMAEPSSAPASRLVLAFPMQEKARQGQLDPPSLLPLPSRATWAGRKAAITPPPYGGVGWFSGA